jgi:aspartyl-tRNA(Asn)/glutamyl-tRNA(Gln) amidotransferase subunit C
MGLMSVTPEDVRHVAALARLGIDETQVPLLVRQLNGILAHMDVLQQVDVGMDLSSLHDGTTPLRDDAVPPVRLARDREAFAPAARDGFFLVPRLATHGDRGMSEET